MSTFQKLKDLVAQAEPENEKFEAGNKAAGTRLRNILMEIKTTAHALRGEVVAKKAEAKASK